MDRTQVDPKHGIESTAECNFTIADFVKQMANRQVRTLGPLMNRLTSTSVYFTSPAPLDTAPLLPGRLVEAVDADVPVMIGKLTSDDSTPSDLPVKGGNACW